MRGHTIGSSIEGIRVPAVYELVIRELSAALSSELSQQQVLGLMARLLSEHATTELAGREAHDGGLFSSHGTNFEKRFQPDHTKVRTICEAMRLVGHSVVLTSGTFDIIHIGHATYLEKASTFGDFLVVGVDSDLKVKDSKGPLRPIVPQEERLRMLSHLRGVGLITLKESADPKWHLIKTVRPDTLIATEGTYDSEEISELEQDHVGRVVVLPPQATTSTTARLRLVQVSHGTEMMSRLLDGVETVDTDDEIKASFRKLIENIMSAE